MQVLLRYHEQDAIYAAWRERQPEYWDWIEDCEKIEQKNSQQTFVGRGLAQPGTLIEVQLEDGRLARLLIGHINAEGGECGCCMPFDPLTTHVLRYRVVWRDPTPFN